MHLTAAANAECVGGVGFVYAQGYVLEQLTEQTLTQVAGGNKLALLAGERRVVDHKGHLNGRLGNLNERQSLNVLGVAQGLTDGYALDAGEANDLACLCLLDRLTAQLLDGVQGNQLRVVRLGVAVVVADGNLLTYLHRAALDTADADTANVLVVVNRRNEHLGRAFGINMRRRNVLEDLLEQRGQVLALHVRGHGSGACTAGAVNNRAVQLLVGRIKVEQQLENLVADLVETSVRTVDLVDCDDDLVTELQCLLQHEAGLRHRAFCCVNQQNNAVYHLEDTLYLAGEVGVARGIYDVDLYALVMYRGVLCQNGNAALTLDVARVHDTLLYHLIFAESASLLEHLIDQSSLAMVNVRNDGDVA